jgi:hypothetical protein
MSPAGLNEKPGRYLCKSALVGGYNGRFRFPLSAMDQE